MAINEQLNAPWTRKHDLPSRPLIPSAAKILYPKSLEELIQICHARKPSERIKAAGSHWALSDAAISDLTFIETHDPQNTFQAMGRTLYDVIPKCLTLEFLDQLASRHPKPFDKNPGNVSTNEGMYLFHVESGKRVYQLYAELDMGDDHVPESLARHLQDQYNNADYLGPWALATLGGAAGQTVFGAKLRSKHQPTASSISI